ncbi:MAG: acyltransferase family protein [Synergistaceae bacterium]|nr:acyltransferase family protein [Synergistaceae bacterium]
MLMIITYHFALHGGFNFSASPLTPNKLWYQFMMMGGSLGNDIFVMLSGYFLIKSSGLKFRRLFDLWLRMLFYWVALFCLSHFCLENSSVTAVRGVLATKVQWWFAYTYCMLYLIHPYINVLLCKVVRDDWKKLIVMLAVLWLISRIIPEEYSKFTRLVTFIFSYSIAGYFRLNSPDFGSVKYIFYGAALIGIKYISVIMPNIFCLRLPLGGMMDPLIIFAVLCFIAGFRKLKITYNKVINILAYATFGVYLIHDSKFVRPFLWHSVFRNAAFQDSPYLIPYSIAVVLIVYISCTMIELTRSRIFKTLSQGRLS